MTSVLSIDLPALPVLDAAAWRQELRARVLGGARVVTLFGRRVEDGVLVTAVLARDGLSVLRGRVPAAAGYHELTSEIPALHCFERELHEQTGLRVAGHPWLKPVRYEGRDQSAMSAHPWWTLDGKVVHEVAVGPIHAGVIEPGSFRFMCHGEQVHHLEIQLGFQHRGVEARLLGSEPRGLAPLVETIAGDSSVAHAWAYCAAIEALAGCELELEVELARGTFLELERVAMHLAGLSGLAADVGFLQGASTYGRLRTTAINTTMKLCGSRFGRGALRPGGVRARQAELGDALSLLETDLATIGARFLGSRTVQHRLQAVGVLSREHASALGVVGLAARASGVALDARRDLPGRAHREVPVAAVVAEAGDCWSRALVRIEEMRASLAWLRSALARSTGSPPPPRVPGALAPDRLVVSVIEGWRGEVVHCLETGPGGALAHYKVQDPSLRNWMGLAIAVRTNEISDFPVCNKSFDLSYCGNDL